MESSEELFGAPQDEPASLSDVPSTVVRTMCPMNCHPTLCGMLAEVREGRLISVKGDQANPDSQGFLCIRGQASREIIGNPARLLYPLVRDRRNDAFRRATWDEAFERIVAGMDDPAAVGIWPGHGIFTTNYGTRISAQLLARFANFHGSQFWNPAMICWGLGAFGLGLTGMLETNTKEDMGLHSEFIILWAANLTSQPNTARHLLAAKRRGAYVVTIDVRYTEAAAKSDEVLIIRPGTDGALALALLHVICAEKLHDAGFCSAKHDRLRATRGATAQVHARVGGRDHRAHSRSHRGTRAPLRAIATGDDRAGRQFNAQRRQRLAGRARDCLPARRHRQRRHSGRGLRAAPWQRCAWARPGQHHRTGAQDDTGGSEPDVRRHGSAARGAHRDLAVDGHQHAFFVCRCGGCRAGIAAHAAHRELRPVPERHRAPVCRCRPARHRVA